MSIPKDLPELIRAGVISPEVGEKIRAHYEGKESQSQNRLIIVFGILGAILAGLGIILIIAHNWDDLSRGTKTFFAFLPLVIGQALCGMVLLKKPESVAWREGASAFLFFGVGASISMVGQIYNIPGDLGSFLLTWMLLCLPVIYLMRSSTVSLLYLIGITTYAVETLYDSYPQRESYVFWALLLAVFPYYYRLYTQFPKGNFTAFHHWAVPICITITLGTVATVYDEFMFIAYFSLFGLFFLVGELFISNDAKWLSNGYRVLGSMGTTIMLFMMSFSEFWREMSRDSFELVEGLTSPEMVACVLLTALAGGLLARYLTIKPLEELSPIAPIFVLFISIFVVGLFSTFAAVLINLIILALAIITIRRGAQKDHLGILNYGLLLIMTLVICRFFDTDLSFVIRGILFLLVGLGFFAANYMMIKKRKNHAE